MDKRNDRTDTSKRADNDWQPAVELKAPAIAAHYSVTDRFSRALMGTNVRPTRQQWDLS